MFYCLHYELQSQYFFTTDCFKEILCLLAVPSAYTSQNVLCDYTAIENRQSQSQFVCVHVE
ncbi:hypothetical protein Q7M85_03280 [Candidatus Liberibacter asiaticus]